MAIPIIAIYVAKLQNHLYGEFVKIRKLTLIIIFVIFPQKRQFRLKNENSEIRRNSA